MQHFIERSNVPLKYIKRGEVTFARKYIKKGDVTFARKCIKKGEVTFARKKKH